MDDIPSKRMKMDTSPVPCALSDIKPYLDALSAYQLKNFTVHGLPGLHYIATLPSKSSDRILLEQIIKLFKNIRCDINEPTNKYTVGKRLSAGFTPLLVAIQESNLPFLETLLEHGGRVDIYDKQGFYPLHWAVFTGDMAIFKKLIQVGGLQAIDERFRNHVIHPILHTAVDEGRTEMVAYLLEEELADPEQLAVYHGMLPPQPIYKAAIPFPDSTLGGHSMFENLDRTIFRTIPPEECFDPIEWNKDSLESIFVPFTPLSRAVRKRNIPIIDVLLKFGPILSGYDDLHYCILRGDVKIACLLVKKLSAEGLANNKMFEKVGLHYLHPVAFENKEVEDDTVNLVDAYVKAGWDLNSLSRSASLLRGFKSYEVDNSSELSLLHLACNFGCKKLIRYLVEKGANVNCVTAGNALLYPLQLSIFCKDWDAVGYLVSNGADGNAVGGFRNSGLSQPYCSMKDLDYQFTSIEILLRLGDVRNLPILRQMMKNGVPEREAMVFRNAFYGKNMKMIKEMAQELCSIRKIELQVLIWIPVNKDGHGVSVPCLHWILHNGWDVHVNDRHDISNLISLMGGLGYDFNLDATRGKNRENSTHVQETSSLEEDPFIVFSILRKEYGFPNRQPDVMDFPMLEALLKFDHVNLNVRNSKGMNPVEFAIHLWNTTFSSDISKMDAVVSLLVRNGVDVSEMKLGDDFQYCQGSMDMIKLLISVGADIQPNLFVPKQVFTPGFQRLGTVPEDIKKLNDWKAKFDKERKLTLKQLCVVKVRKMLKSIGDVKTLDGIVPGEVKVEVEGEIWESE